MSNLVNNQKATAIKVTSFLLNSTQREVYDYIVVNP